MFLLFYIIYMYLCRRKPDTVSVRASEVWNVDAMDDSEPTVNV